jgi:nitrate/TMAO reductase-like tetraheme cytochrome c subunit
MKKKMPVIIRRSLFIIHFSLFTALLVACGSAAPAGTISGVVRDEEGAAVAGAVVRVQTTRQTTLADERGRFSLSASNPLTLTAWSPGYFIGGGEQNFAPGSNTVELVLHRHAGQDNPDYQWVSAYASAGSKSNCQNCHEDPQGQDRNLPFSQWQQDAHAQAAQNPRFLTMYNGTDLQGNQSPPTRYGFSRDYGRFPLRPDESQPWFGPGYKLDFPGTDGNCAACHTPLAAANTPYGVNPAALDGVAAEGINCDFCHKVWDVTLNPETNLPYPDMPGVLSLEFRRPPEGHQFFAGPLDDVAPGEDTFSPLQTQSHLCAACHFGVFWDTVVYNSFGEWLASPYSNPETGKTCQDCHMPPSGATHFTRPDKGGLERSPETIYSHQMPGAADETLLQNAVTLSATARAEGGNLLVRVEIVNDKSGHSVPTDSPLRQVILLVQAIDAAGKPLKQSGGPVVPDWGGQGDPAQGYYAGLPGKGFAKILEELWTEISPSGAYWNPTRIVSDNRLQPFQPNVSEYAFALPNAEQATVTVTLLHRRAFKKLMDQKGWDSPDIVMARLVLRK